MKHITIIRNAVRAQLIDEDRKAKEIVQRALSYEVNEGFGKHAWTGTTSMFDWDTCKFPAGFTQAVKKKLEQLGYKVRVHRKPLPAPLGVKNPVVNNYPDNPDYGYQNETVERLVEQGGIIGQIATGGGKSEIACIARARIGRMTLFLTTQGSLMHQMRGNFNKAFEVEKANGTLRPDATCGIIGDGEFQLSRTCNVATVQSIAAATADPKPEWTAKQVREHLKKKRLVTQILEQTALLILEEAHEASSDTFYHIAQLCKNADYRLALTATPFMKDSVEANMRLLASVGGIGIRVTEKYLIDRGILAKPYFRYLNVTYKPDQARIDADLAGKFPSTKLANGSAYQKAYTLGIVYNLARNNQIVEQAQTFKRYGLTTLMLVKRTRHGEILRDMLEAKGVRARFISGRDSQTKRDAAIALLSSGEIDVLVSSTITDVGVDIPSVGSIIIAGGDKAEVQNRQRIGRGLRAKKVGINQCFIVDFIDITNKHLRKHSYERKAIVMETDGFKQGVLSNRPFPFDEKMIA